MAKLAIIVGHEKKSPGADIGAPINSTEYKFNSEIARLMYVFAREKSLDARVFYRDVIKIVGVGKAVKDWGADYAIELHCNSADPKAYGTETLYDKEPEESKAFAEYVQRHVCSAFKRTGKGDRGVKLVEPGGRGHYNLKVIECVSALAEPFFGSNKDDCKLAWSNASGYANALVNAVVLYIKDQEKRENNHA